MTLILKHRDDITLDAVYRVAWQGEPIALHDAALARMKTCRDAFMRLIDSDENIVIYGVTSGYGQMAHLRYTPEERRSHAKRPPDAAASSFGEPLPERVARAIVLARLANFLEGHAAVSPALAEAVAAMLGGVALPPVPALGNGCPGEILALAHLFRELAAGFDLGEKESVSLVNGSPCATALLADAVLAARGRLALAVEIFALAAEALKAPLGHYDPVLEALWGDPHETAMLRQLRSWMEGGAADRRSYQAPVSWRIVPRVLGQAQRALDQGEALAAISLKAVSDNPVFIPPDEAHPNGRAISTGGYHNGGAYPALDSLAAAWADLALLCDRQVTKLFDGTISHLPAQLRGAEEGYLGCLGFTALGYAEQARQAAQRTFLPGSEGGGFGQNDVAVPTFLAWRKEAEAGHCLEAGLACLAIAASQAFHVTERQPPPALAPLVEQVRSLFPPMEAQRAPGPEAGLVREWLTGKVFAGDMIARAA